MLIDELQKAIDEAAMAGVLMIRKSQMSFDFTAPNPHHVAYTRTNASGTVSNIQAKGAPAVHPQAHRVGDKVTIDHDLQHEAAGKDGVITKVHAGGGIGATGIADYTVEVPGHGREVYGHGEIKPAANETKPNAIQMTEADAGTHLENVATAEEQKQLIDGVYKVGNDLLNNPMLAEHHDNIRRKLEGLKANPDAKSAAQVAGDLKLIVDKAAPHRIGDTVHLGFGTKGGAGVIGKLLKMDDGMALVQNDEGRTFKGHFTKLSKP